MQATGAVGLRRIRRTAGLLAVAVALGYLARVADADALRTACVALTSHPLGLAVALLAYAAAFALRVVGWRRVLPALGAGQAWAALHVSLLGNHVLPFRLGEALRVSSVVRRTRIPVAAATASAVTLRAADLLAVLALAAVGAPRLLGELAGRWAFVIAAVVLVAAAAGVAWLVVLRRRGAVDVRLPGATVAATALAAWCLESVVMWQAARWAGVDLSPAEAVAVTAVTIAAQTVAVTPGGIGSYEAAATAAMVLLDAPADAALAGALTAHAVKTAYSLVVGAVALVVPAPTYWGHWRLPVERPPRPCRAPVAPDAPVVVFLPAHDEEAVVGDVVRRIPATVHGRDVRVVVVDDGSTDATGARAAAAGAAVVTQSPNRGLGAAVRRGLAECVATGPAAVVYLDADGEYDPADIDALVAPVLTGAADYVVGSRFTGRIEVMRPHRRLGNRVLTAWLRLVARLPVTDGQSGMRAFSPQAAASAEVVHDYNYAQVLTLDLVAKGFRYAEVPIRYRFRETGQSFVRLGRYLRRVVPAVHREVNLAWAEAASGAVSPPPRAARSAAAPPPTTRRPSPRR